jgi:hypothetical protein
VPTGALNLFISSPPKLNLSFYTNTSGIVRTYPGVQASSGDHARLNIPTDGPYSGILTNNCFTFPDNTTVNMGGYQTSQ